MQTDDHREMFLSAPAEEVARALSELGAEFSDGHRDVGMQAVAMAENVVQNRQWIKETYLFPGPLQGIVDENPDATDVRTLAHLLLDGLNEMDELARGRLTHHLAMPCDVFDLKPESVIDVVIMAMHDFERQGKIVKILAKEGGLVRWHVECSRLPLNKVIQV